MKEYIKQSDVWFRCICGPKDTYSVQHNTASIQQVRSVRNGDANADTVPTCTVHCMRLACHWWLLLCLVAFLLSWWTPCLFPPARLSPKVRHYGVEYVNMYLRRIGM
jgi:hypothetical protein